MYFELKNILIIVHKTTTRGTTRSKTHISNIANIYHTSHQFAVIIIHFQGFFSEK